MHSTNKCGFIVETVICRLYYEGKCASGKMNVSQFRKCNFTQMIKNLGPNVDLNNVCISCLHKIVQETNIV